MNISSLFISRPVAAILISISIALSGFVAFVVLPVSPLPQVDFATISVTARLPGASPETMAATVATPLERTLGRIAGVEEMTSQSSLGFTSIILQFDLEKNIDAAAREVQAAINAARDILPTLPSNPTYRKLNPSDAPIMIVALTSDAVPTGELYDIASRIISQKISQIYGVGQVQVSGSSLPAIRVLVDPGSLFESNIPLEDVRGAIFNANVNIPKGYIDAGDTRWILGANDNLSKPDEFSNIIIKHKNFNNIKLKDIAKVEDSVENIYNAGYVNGKEGVLLIIYKEPGANIIDTVERINKTLPLLRAWTPESIDFTVLMDRSPSIKTSLIDVEITLVIAMILVTLIVFLFLRNSRATFIPAISIPVSLLGTFGIMYLLGYSLNHLSLMALTIATGFVVDDAIVVTENIVRHMENGISPKKAALLGSQEVAFTVISMSLSLVAIFIPILFMGGMLGRFFKEFSVTLATAVLVSMLISLITTPALCAVLLKPEHFTKNFNITKYKLPLYKKVFYYLLSLWERFLDALQEGYAITLFKVIKHKKTTLLCLICTIVATVFLYIYVPKGLFPEQDTSVMLGFIRADQSISFQAMLPKLKKLMSITQGHPDVLSIGGFTGGRQANSGFAFINLKSKKDRQKSVAEIMVDLRKDLEKVPGASMILIPAQDLRAGGRGGQASYQYTLLSDNLQSLREQSTKLAETFANIPGIVDARSDQESRGLEISIESNKNLLARLNITQRQVDNTLGLAFGQRFASTIFTENEQYRVVMTYDNKYLNYSDSLNFIYFPHKPSTNKNRKTNYLNAISNNSYKPLIPLKAFADFVPGVTPLSVSHQGQNIATTISFNILPGYSFSQIQEAVDEAVFNAGLPINVQGGFEGTAKAFKDSIKNQLVLLLAAFLTLYIVLGVLYESLIHPLTILSTLPSAGAGAILALILYNTEFSLIAFIGVLLLCGIVKKNAIMMVDFAIVAKREGASPFDAIYKACLLRFRPIMMTTFAAIFGAVPLVLASGEGAEIRTPLGITIIGGLIVSQILTLYTTPVVYLCLDRFTKTKRNFL